MVWRSVLITTAILALFIAAPAQADNYHWATDVVWFAGQNSGTPERSITSNALGEDDGNFLSLGLDGFAIFAFDTTFEKSALVLETTNGGRSDYPEGAEIFVAGSDFDEIFEDFISGGTYDLTNTGGTYTPPASDPLVAPSGHTTQWTSADFANSYWDYFISAGVISNINAQNTVDLTGVGTEDDRPFKYVLVLDRTRYIENGKLADGFDVTAVGVAGTPEPASLLLFGSAAGLLGYFRRRKNQAKSEPEA